MNRKDLEKMKLEELKKMASDLGVRHHHNAGAPKIVTAILAALEGNTDAADAEGDDLPETEIVNDDEEGPSVEDVLSGETVDVADAPQAPAKPNVVLSVKPDEKNKLEEIIRKEMTEWPTVAKAEQALAGHVARGLMVIKLEPDYWHFKVQNREASGNLKMPLKNIVHQAELLFAKTARPTEGLDVEEILALKVPRK